MERKERLYGSGILFAFVKIIINITARRRGYAGPWDRSN